MKTLLKIFAVAAAFGMVPAAAPAQQPAPAPRPNAETAQPRLGIEAADKPRGSAMDDDLLDIPAFLRRQAN